MSVLLVDDDDILLGDASRLDHDSVAFAMSRSTAEARLRCASADFDVMVVSLDLPGGEDLIRDLRRTAPAPLMIAIAARAMPGFTLEHTLLRAELRGAALALPKPLDAIEIARAISYATGGAHGPGGKCAGLVAGLERRIASRPR
jgi:CheY-like chemotaxis protein